MYETLHKEYVITGNKIVVRNKPEFVALEFDSYIDCLKFAKKYVAEFIRKHEKQFRIKGVMD
jgi:hypothetical protein